MAGWRVTLHGATGSDERLLSLHPCTLQNTSPGQIMIAIAKPRATRIRSQYQIKLCCRTGLWGAASTRGPPERANALPASFSGIIMISYESSVYTAITPLKLAGSAVGPLRLPPCTLSQVRHSSHRWDSAGRSPGR